jgi:hypothetical protein
MGVVGDDGLCGARRGICGRFGWRSLVFPALSDVSLLANGSSSAPKHERPLQVHRHGDELQMAGIAGEAQIADAAHPIPALLPYQRFIVAKARSTAERTLPAQALWNVCQVSNG